MEIGVIINFLLSLSIGAIIGIEREITFQREKRTGLAGIRTFMLTAIFGFVSTYISINLLNSTAALIVSFISFILIIVSSYTLSAIKTRKIGATTEVAAVLTYLLSVIVSLNTPNTTKFLAIIIAVIVASLLALKERLHNFAKNIKTKEVYAAIKFAIISIVLLPFLPNQNYTLLDIPFVKDLISTFPSLTSIAQQLNIFNPFKIWLIVVFISGLSFVGYILVKLFGSNKGIGITSALGGMVSSTAVTVSLSEKSKGKKIVNSFAFGIILASSIMFIRVLIEVSAINSSLLKFLVVPIGIMALSGLVSAFIISRKEKSTGDSEFKSPFALAPALKFGIFFVFILFLSKLLYIFFGNSGLLIAALVSGFADVDAITMSLSSLALLGTIEPRTAVIGITLAVSANTLTKGVITYVMGDKNLAKKVAIIFLIVLVLGISSSFLL